MLDWIGNMCINFLYKIKKIISKNLCIQECEYDSIIFIKNKKLISIMGKKIDKEVIENIVKQI